MIRSICLFICVATSTNWRPATAQEYLGQWYGTSEAAGDLYALFAPDTLDLWFFDADSLCYELSQWSYAPGIPNFSLTSIDGEEGAGSLTYEVAITYVTGGMNLTFFDDETGAELVFNLVPNAALLDDLTDCAGIDGPDDSGEGTCSGDFDSDGSITVNDMLAVLGQFGCSTDCITDLDDDGVVGVADMLALLSVFGQTCL